MEGNIYVKRYGGNNKYYITNDYKDGYIYYNNGYSSYRDGLGNNIMIEINDYEKQNILNGKLLLQLKSIYQNINGGYLNWGESIDDIEDLYVRDEVINFLGYDDGDYYEEYEE